MQSERDKISQKRKGGQDEGRRGRRGREEALVTRTFA
jgi:hypothetical protein